MVSLQGYDRLPPCRFADVLDVAEVLLVAELDGLAFNDSGDDDLFPRGHMQYQFPNAVRGGHGPRGGGCGVDVGNYFHEGRAVPGFAIEGKCELVYDEID